jgi:hypothetical protein
LIFTRGLPFGLGHTLAQRRLSSLPRTPVAGPLSVETRATIAVLQEAIRLASRNPGVQLQIKRQADDLDGLIDGVVSTPWRLSYLLDLQGGPEGPFRVGNSHSRASIKWAINKAARLGVYARPAETEAELHTWYWLYLETMRRNVVPPRSYRFFLALWQLLRPRGMMQLLLAEQKTKTGTRIIAGSIFLRFGRTVSYAFNGSGLRDFPLRPNDVIQWEAINEARASGYRYLDFGEVPEGHDELAKFKSKWGATPIRMHRYYCPGRANSDGDRAKAMIYTEALGSAIWRRLPLRALGWLGDRIYGYL